MSVTDIEKYRTFCKTEKKIPIFSKDWWLDAVCSEPGISWDVVILLKGDDIIASMPYCIKRKRGLTYITMPKLTQTIGPWFRDSKAKYAKTLSQQKSMIKELIQKLPPFDHFVQNFHYSITNWLPFYWDGFEQSTQYTYIIKDLTNLEKIWESFQDNIRREIKKAKNRFYLKVDSNLDIDKFFELNYSTFRRQGLRPPYSVDFIRQLDNSCKANNSRKIFYARDNQGIVHAAIYIVWDEVSAYYLMGGTDQSKRNSGANSLCMWEAIKFASTVTGRFDFEGSMIESVERFFRGFGARQMPYFRIKKVNSRLLKLMVAISAIKYK
jgi:hypothetical protein